MARAPGPAPGTAPGTAPVQRLTCAADTSVGAILKFLPTSSYSYPSSCVHDAQVTYLETHGGQPPAHVRWSNGFTYWVHWQDLVIVGGGGGDGGGAAASSDPLVPKRKASKFAAEKLVMRVVDVVGPPPDVETVPDLKVALAELDQQIGLEEVKKQVRAALDGL